MSEQDLLSADLLNQLYAMESGSLLARLPELSIFASGAQCGRLQLLQKLAAESLEHREWLIEAIDVCGGCLRPATLDPATGSLHYVSIEAILPRVISSLEQLVDTYSEASRRKPLTQPAAEVIDRIRRRYASRLQQLQAACPA